MKEKIVNSVKAIWRKKFVFAGIILLAAGVWYFGFRERDIDDKKDMMKTDTVKKGDIVVVVTGTGQIHAKSQVDLKGVAAGDGIDVIQVNVKNDQEVKKGDLVAVLDTTEPMKNVRNAQLNLEGALIAQKKTNHEFDNQTTENKWERQAQEVTVKQWQSSVSDAQSDLQDCYIRAPFDGIVTGLSVEAGDSISRDDIIASVITREMYAEVSLNEVDAVKVKKGNEVTLTFDALPDLVIQGTVDKIDTIGEVSQNVVAYGAEIAFESTSELLKPGMSVSAEIAAESREDVLQVSASAIKTDTDGSSYVQVLEKGGNYSEKRTSNDASPFSFAKQKVKTGLSDEVMMEIVSGLKEGDVVVTSSNIGIAGSTQEKGGSLFDFSRPGSGMRR